MVKVSDAWADQERDEENFSAEDSALVLPPSALGGVSNLDVPPSARPFAVQPVSAEDRFFAEARSMALQSLGVSASRAERHEAISSAPRPGSLDEVTTSQETLDRYTHISTGMMSRFLRETGTRVSGDDYPYERLADWFVSRRLDLQPSSYTYYRSALLNYLRGVPGDAASNAEAILSSEGGDDDDAEEDFLPVTRNRKTRLRRFPIDDYDRAITMLRHGGNSGSVNNIRLADLLDATVLTGLRPAEWKATDLRRIDDTSAPYGRQVWLFAVNAKTSNGRSNGILRSLDLTELEDEAIEPVARTSEVGRLMSEVGDYEKLMLDRLQTHMRRTVLRLFGPDPQSAYSIYSCRHQAISNWKVTMQPAEVAALSGHAVARTAATHYGHVSDAWPAERRKAVVRPHADEVARVEARLNLFKEREVKRARIEGRKVAIDAPLQAMPTSIDF